MYDLIGDIHGYASELKLLLKKLGYELSNNAYQHPDGRIVIFIGDYIDRGPKIREVLQIVKAMTDQGNAIALMGNHEYNALAYSTKDSNGEHLRKHSEKNNHQHQETIKQFEDYQEEWEEYKRWFYTLPLFIDKQVLRAVHACWNSDHIKWLSDRNFYTMTKELLFDSSVKGSEAHEVINDTLKGKEINIPEEHKWQDKQNHWRTENRYKWWMDPKTSTYEYCIFDCPQSLKDNKVTEDIKIAVYPKDAPPVFFGHYWLEDEYPVIQKDNVICLDYSVASGKVECAKLVAYRFNGETKLDKNNFVYVDR